MWHDDHSEEVTQGPSQRFLSCKARRDGSVKRMKRSRKVPGSPTAHSKLESSGLEGFEVDPICGGNHPCVPCRRCQTEFPGSAVGRGWRSLSMGGGGLLQKGAAPEAWDKTFHCHIQCAQRWNNNDHWLMKSYLVMNGWKLALVLGTLCNGRWYSAQPQCFRDSQIPSNEVLLCHFYCTKFSHLKADQVSVTSYKLSQWLWPRSRPFLRRWKLSLIWTLD